MVRVSVHATAEEYLAVAIEALERDEVGNNLVLGVPLRLRMHPERIKAQPYLATVQDGATFAGCAVLTPPYHLVIHAEDGFGESVVEAVAHDLAQRGWPITGVNGRVPHSDAFAQHWQKLSGRAFRLETDMRVFVLNEVTPPQPSPGALRRATDDDFGIVATFLRAFDAEVLPGSAGKRTDEQVRLAIDDGSFFLWEDERRVVSLAGKARPLLHGITIAPVYTPPELRGQGYASNAVAALSQMLLEAGWRFTCLFTDLANPTSNSIYQRIGYRPVCDYASFSFIQNA